LILDRLLDAVQGYAVEGFPPFYLFARLMNGRKEERENEREKDAIF
jgi:hypothetical protein